MLSGGRCKYMELIRGSGSPTPQLICLTEGQSYHFEKTYVQDQDNPAQLLNVASSICALMLKYEKVQNNYTYKGETRAIMVIDAVSCL